jgi:hypothetical protein
MESRMGVDYNGLRALLLAKRKGANFERSIMLGRQQIFLSQKDVGRCFDDFSIKYQPSDINRITDSNYCEELFQFLGASVVDSLDASSYEGATLVYDLNHPLPDRIHNKYTLVFDGGALEHIFNVPVAFQNVLRLATRGGRIVSLTPCNNLMGHGFYQFSPELLFRVFNNGQASSISYLLLYHANGRGDWFSVADPKELGHRVTLLNTLQTYMVMIAEKTGDILIDALPPQQSDYQDSVWKNGDELPIKRVHTSARKDFIRGLLPSRLQEVFSACRVYLREGGFGVGYRRVDPSDL